MKQIFVRPARKEDLEKLLQWGNMNPAWDQRALDYSFTWCAYSDGEVVAFQPVQRPVLLEAAAFHPASTDPQRALAMKELTHTIITHAYEGGAGEIMFLGSDGRTNIYAEHQGFRLVDLPLYRVRLRELEEKGGPTNGSAT